MGETIKRSPWPTPSGRHPFAKNTAPRVCAPWGLVGASMISRGRGMGPRSPTSLSLEHRAACATAALPLFAGSLGALDLLGWCRKEKAGDRAECAVRNDCTVVPAAGQAEQA